MLTDANSNNLMPTEVRTVASCSDLQTGHLRLAAYNLAFFSLLGLIMKPQLLRGKPSLQNQATLSKIGKRGDKKVDRTIRSGHHCRSPIKSRSTGESLTCRALHRGGANPTHFPKNVNDFLQVFSDFFAEETETVENQREFRKIFFGNQHNLGRFSDSHDAFDLSSNDFCPFFERQIANYDASSSCVVF